MPLHHDSPSRSSAALPYRNPVLPGFHPDPSVCRVGEDYYLVCLKPTLDTPAVGGLRATLASPAWAQALQGLPGYGVQRPGEVLSLTHARPWWHYRRPKTPT